MTLKPAQGFKSKFITADLAHLFSQSDSEEEEFEGFSEEEDEERGRISKRLKTMRLQLVQLEEDSEEESEADTGFYSDGEESPPPKRRSLCVALRFPIKRLSAPKPNVREKKDKKTITTPPRPPPSGRRTSQRTQQKKTEEKEEETKKLKEETKKWKEETQQKKTEEKEETKKWKEETKKWKKETRKKEEEVVKEEEEEEEAEEEDEDLSPSLRKRDKNIKENKAMLAKLFADLGTMAELTPLNTPQNKKKRTPATATSHKRKSEPEARIQRVNPSRKARPREHFGLEERSESPSREARGARSTMDTRRLVEVDGEMVEEGRKKRGGFRRSSQYLVRSVDEITEDDLDNIAYRAKDKIWDKENGSSCHQCRQKTLDTKTVCRSGFCVGGKGQFCAPCLKNRYGEDVRKVLLDPTWSCPICRRMCNCSLCRKREGRCATGILVGQARYNGHNNVHQYLESIQKELEES